MGIDYSLMVAAELRIEPQTAFERHDKLRRLGLIQRVNAVMVQYRKGIAKNKWIKHRNHTYYDLTEKGKKYYRYFKERNR
jgi:predicted transcriptional regulator